MMKNRPLAISRWAALAVALVISAIMIAGGRLPNSLTLWALTLLLAVMVGVVHNLGVASGVGLLTFVHVVAMISYFSLGFEPALLALMLGMLGGGLAQIVERPEPHTSRFERLAEEAGPAARNILSLLVGHGFYGILFAAPLPFVSGLPLSSLLPLIVMIAGYLTTFNLLLMLDLNLRHQKGTITLIDHRRSLLAAQVLPTPLIPFSAVILSDLGTAAFIIFQGIVLTIVVAINRLVETQGSLQQQIKQLSSFSAMNRALRTTLDLDALMENVYLQSRNLLNVRNLWIVLREPGETTWSIAFAVVGGRRRPVEDEVVLDGLTQWVLEMRFPLFVDPLERAVSELQITNLPTDARAWMGVPLGASKRVLGAIVTWLNPDEQPGRAFTENDLEIFTAIAVQTGVALENALLYNNAQSYAEQLTRLNEISALMNASLNQEMVLNLIASSVIEVAGCDKSALYLLSQNADGQTTLNLTQVQGFSPEHIARNTDLAVPLSQEEFHEVIEARHTVSVSDIHKATPPVSNATRTLAEREGFQAYVYIPLVGQNRPIGMLAVYYERPHEFTISEVELLETFANQAALAVANARIYQRVDVELTRRVEQIVAVAEISRQLSSTLELETVFDLIIDQATDGIGAERSVLVLTEDPQLGNLDTNRELNMVAWRGFDPATSTRAPHQIVEELLESDILETGAVVNQLEAESGPQSKLSLPITIDTRVIGAIALEHAERQAFSPEDMAFVSQLMGQAATAIRNAQLFRRAEIVRDRLHAILDASNDGLLMIDERSRIVMTNTRMGDFWDFARGDFEASPDQQRLIDDPLTVLGEGLGYKGGELKALLKRAIRNPNMPPQTDLYVTRAAERQRFVERTVMPVRDERMAFIGLLLLFRDVTQQKELEETRENLTRMMVHDLRGPLTAVMTSINLIRKTAQPENNIIENATETSERALRKVLHMVNDMLDLARMSDGSIQIDPAITPVGPLLNDAVKELTPLAQELNIVVQMDIATDLPPAMIDRSMIERVTLNLLDNALKYTEPGTLVELRAARDLKEDMLRIEIADQGPGIPAEFKDVIFDRFKQIPGRKGRRHSAGIGLAFCRLAVEAHGGAIWVEDNPGGGALFKFTLPRLREAGTLDGSLEWDEAPNGTAN